MSTIAAYVIAGGRSSRMGRDKAFLELGGETLLARAVRLARSVSEGVSIVGPQERIAELRNRVTAELKIVEDVYPGQGPLAGIHAALKSSEAELNLMLGVDTPFLEARFLKYLVEQAENSGAVVTVPVVGKTNRPQMNTDKHGFELKNSDQCSSVLISGRSSGAQPLCAVYRREFADVAEEALRARRNNIVPLYAKVTTRRITDEELQKLAFDPIMFENLNTPEEWERAKNRGI